MHPRVDANPLTYIVLLNVCQRTWKSTSICAESCHTEAEAELTRDPASAAMDTGGRVGVNHG